MESLRSVHGRASSVGNEPRAQDSSRGLTAFAYSLENAHRPPFECRGDACVAPTSEPSCQSLPPQLHLDHKPATTAISSSDASPNARVSGSFLTTLVIIVSALVISTLPFLVAYWSTPAGLQFGGFVLNVEDANSHVAKMMLGKRGEWLFYLNYSPEVHEGAFVNSVWNLLGWLAARLSLPLLAMWHIARVAFGLFYLMAVVVTINYFVADRRQRTVALFLAAFGSGLGWVPLLFGQQIVAGARPIDFWLAEAYSTPILVGYPHILLAVAMLLLTFVLALKALEAYTLPPGLAAGLCALVFVLIHPFGVAVVDLSLVTYVLALRLLRSKSLARSLLAIAPVFLLPLPLFAYDVVVFLTNDVFRAWSEQNLCLSPSPFLYLLGYGVMVPLAMLGMLASMRASAERSVFLLVWTTVVAILLYVPFNSQRRFIEGLIVPLAILSARGIAEYVLPYIRQRMSYRLTRISVPIILTLTLPSTLIFVGGLTSLSLQHPARLYQDVLKMEAIEWLGARTKPDEVVLSSQQTGNLIPAVAGNAVVVGHWAETIGFQEKQRFVKTFFDERTTDEQRREILERFRVSYLFYGPEERALGDYDVEGSPLLRLVYANQRYRILRVILSDEKPMAQQSGLSRANHLTFAGNRLGAWATG